MSSKKTVIDPKIGVRFAIVRARLNLSQKDMAELCDMYQGNISRVEKGIRDIPTAALQNLYLKKNISPTYILCGAVEVESTKSDAETQLSSKLKYMEADIEILKAEIERLKKNGLA